MGVGLVMEADAAPLGAWDSGGCVVATKITPLAGLGRRLAGSLARGLSLTPRFSEVSAEVARSEPFQRFSGLRQVSHSAGTRSLGSNS